MGQNIDYGCWCGLTIAVCIGCIWGSVGEMPNVAALRPPSDKDKRDYDAHHYIRLLDNSYLSRLRKAFSAEDFERLFRKDRQRGMFDQPTNAVQPLWIAANAT